MYDYIYGLSSSIKFDWLIVFIAAPSKLYLAKTQHQTSILNVGYNFWRVSRRMECWLPYDFTQVSPYIFIAESVLAFLLFCLCPSIFKYIYFN